MAKQSEKNMADGAEAVVSNTSRKRGRPPKTDKDTANAAVAQENQANQLKQSKSDEQAKVSQRKFRPQEIGRAHV